MTNVCTDCTCVLFEASLPLAGAEAVQWSSEEPAIQFSECLQLGSFRTEDLSCAASFSKQLRLANPSSDHQPNYLSGRVKHAWHGELLD